MSTLGDAVVGGAVAVGAVVGGAVSAGAVVVAGGGAAVVGGAVWAVAGGATVSADSDGWVPVQAALSSTIDPSSEEILESFRELTSADIEASDPSAQLGFASAPSLS